MEKRIKELIDRYLDDRITEEETLELMNYVAFDPEVERYIISNIRMEYDNEQHDEYGSFIPASSFAADDGSNLCDFQCESFILKKEGVEKDLQALSGESRKNYWLRDQGTPLYNMGKLLENEGFLVNRSYGKTLEDLIEALDSLHVIVVVNGDVLKGGGLDVLSDDFSLEDTPNHAVVVLGISLDKGIATLFNPAEEDSAKEYDLEVFLAAWNESNHYMVTARRKKCKEEYNPQPIDTSSVQLNDSLLETTELICENAHDIWAVDKFAAGYVYAPLKPDGSEADGKFSHFLLPYAMLSEEDKDKDRMMVLGTIRFMKRLGYRLVNVNEMHKCTKCGCAIEPNFHFCPNCGRELTWEDFRFI